MSGLFETRVESLETPAHPPTVRSLTRKKKRKIPRNGKLSPFRIMTKIPKITRNPKQEEILSVSCALC